MNLKEFEKRKNALWWKYEQELASPTAEAIKSKVENNLRLSKDDEETLHDLDGYLKEEVPIW